MWPSDLQSPMRSPEVWLRASYGIGTGRLQLRPAMQLPAIHPQATVAEAAAGMFPRPSQVMCSPLFWNHSP